MCVEKYSLECRGFGQRALARRTKPARANGTHKTPPKRYGVPENACIFGERIDLYFFRSLYSEKIKAGAENISRCLGKRKTELLGFAARA